jgi:hypothetical protein
LSNHEYEAQSELRKFFDRALVIQKERRDGGYGESWQEGRPVGVTDNLGWMDHHKNKEYGKIDNDLSV